MAQVWSNSSVFIKEEEINWNINDFALMWNASGGKKIKSPEYQIGDNKYRLFISEQKGYPINVDGVLVKPADNLVVAVIVYLVVHPKQMMLTGASLSIDVKGHKISGLFGDPTGKGIHAIANPGRNATFCFKNQTSKVELNGNLKDIYFCINRHATQVGIQVKLYGPSQIINTTSQESVKESGAARLVADMRALLTRSKENADFSIECGGKTFPCHEFILRARSSVLEAMFHNGMNESSVRSMTVMDVSPNTMAAFLEYLYTGAIAEEVDDMKELIYIADKYDIEGLLELCFRKLPEVDDHMVVDFLFMADKHNLVEFKKEAMLRIKMNKARYMEDQVFVEKLQEVPRLLVELFKL